MEDTDAAREARLSVTERAELAAARLARADLPEEYKPVEPETEEPIELERTP